MEEFRPVVGFEGLYEISNKGNLRGVGKHKTKKIHKPSKAVNGYYRFNLVDENGKSFTKYQHRLVGMAWVENVNGYKEINHLDEDKSNCEAVNLVWCTRKENCNWGTRQEKIMNTKRSIWNERGYVWSKETITKMKEAKVMYVKIPRTQEMIDDISIGLTKFCKKYNVSESFYYKTRKMYTKAV